MDNSFDSKRLSMQRDEIDQMNHDLWVRRIAQIKREIVEARRSSVPKMKSKRKQDVRRSKTAKS